MPSQFLSADFVDSGVPSTPGEDTTSERDSWFLTGEQALLCHMDNTDTPGTFLDSGPNAHTITAINSTTQSGTGAKFGSGAGQFTQAGDRAIRVAAHDVFNPKKGDFTVEWWGDLNAPANAMVTWGVGRVTSSSDSYIKEVFLANGERFVEIYDASSQQQAFTTSTSGTAWATGGQWYAVEKYAGTIYLYTNGVIVGSVASTYDLGLLTEHGLWFGNDQPDLAGGSNLAIDGEVDELSVDIGIARFKGTNYTVRSSARVGL